MFLFSRTMPESFPAPSVAERPSMEQFVLLSILLHVLMIALFGDTVGGGPTRGERLWGSLSVSMQQLLPDRGVQSKPEPGTDLNPSGAALLRRSGGLANESGARPTTERPLAPDATGNRDITQIDPASTAAEPAQPIIETETAAPAAALQPLPFIAKETDKPVTNFVVPPARADRATAPASELAVPLTPMAPVAAPEAVLSPKFEREFVPKVEPLPRLTPITPSAAPETVPSTKIRRDFAPPLEQRPREVPIVPPPALERLPVPKIERELLPPPKPLPREAPLPAPPSPLDRIAPSRIDRQFAPPTELKVPEPAVPPPVPLDRIAPPTQADREFAPPPAPRLREAPSPTVLPERSPAPANERNVRPAPEAVSPRNTGATSSDSSPRPDPGAASRAQPSEPPSPASANSDPLGDLLKPGARELSRPAPATAPKLDLDSLKRQAREAAREGNGPRTLLPFPTISGKPEVKNKVQEAFDKALKRPDCKDAYSSMGLAAVIPLVRDAVKDDGCKW
jgi:hypothetical protein